MNPIKQVCASAASICLRAARITSFGVSWDFSKTSSAWFFPAQILERTYH
jgi:hypothetical protein